ncbi:MAG: ABC transporter permease [Paenibacillus sp.]|uniref:ABC transporter permease n=1 Tax=Paenibacillus sp. TaxID=58172 RepID=UPI0029037B2E|nr:ABC transporter permease [Paenibacillus sp.]MDU2240864.1 ABC transporter permease [Paenibacillus sp.]
MLSKAGYIRLGALAFLLLFLAWSALTYTGWVKPLFLPTPTQVLQTFLNLLANEGLAADIWTSIYRVIGGFVLAAVIAIPLGMAMGINGAVQAFFEPVISLIRYMPASAFIPLFILWIGLGEAEKMTVIFFGTFFSLTLMIMDVTKNVSKDLIEISYTLGATKWQIFSKIIYPAVKPGMVDSLRLSFGAAWTYLIVAEIVGADSGVGYMIMNASRFLRSDNMIVGIIVIGILGLISDLLFKWFYKKSFGYLNKGGN